MMKALTILAAAILFCGCDIPHYAYTDPQEEPAEVVETCYVPSGHGSGMGVGMSMKGETSISSVDVDIPARYAVVFKCQHGQFVIEGDRGEGLFKRLSKGDRVRLAYESVLEVTKVKTNWVSFHLVAVEKQQ